MGQRLGFATAGKRRRFARGTRWTKKRFMTQDHVVRAMTDDGAFRCITVNATATVRTIVEAQGADAATSRLLGELVVGSVLYRETMAPTLRVQCICRGGNSTGTLVADAHPDGMTRGLYQAGKQRPFSLVGDGALLQMTRNLPTGSQHQGIVGIPSASLEAAFMTYFDQSEQVLTMIGLGVGVTPDGAVDAAGGYLVQLLPEARESRGPLAVLTERFEDFRDMPAVLHELDVDPRTLMERLFDGMPFTWLADSTIRFGCTCSQERILSSLATLHRSEIESLVSEGEPLEMTCDYCGRGYHVELATLQGLLSPS
jgi:molecular chaperone Hsp33